MKLFTSALLAAAVATAGISYTYADDTTPGASTPQQTTPTGTNAGQQTAPTNQQVPSNRDDVSHATPADGTASGTDNRNMNNNAGNNSGQNGHEQLAPATTARIYDRLASIVNSAATNNGLKDLIGGLAKNDRDSLSQNMPSDFSQLNAKIDQFRADFRNKYSQDFNVSANQFGGLNVWKGADDDHALVSLGDLYGAQGVDWRNTRPSAQNEAVNGTANAATNANSPLHNNSGSDDTSRMNNSSDNPGNRNAGAGSKGVTAENANKMNTTDGNTGVADSSKTAEQNISGMHSALANAQLHLVHEASLSNGWRLETSNQGSSQNLADALGRTLDQLHTNQATWPADVSRAYRVIATQILTTVNNGGTNNMNTTVENR